MKKIALLGALILSITTVSLSMNMFTPEKKKIRPIATAPAATPPATPPADSGYDGDVEDND